MDVLIPRLNELAKAIESHKTGVFEKMSKSRGNGISVDEVARGVASVEDGFEFRDLYGEVVPVENVKTLGVWKDHGHYTTARRFGSWPVFLHFVGNPIPAALAGPHGNYIQHPNLQAFWRDNVDRYGDDHGYFDE